jgi:hypothetical protein
MLVDTEVLVTEQTPARRRPWVLWVSGLVVLAVAAVGGLFLVSRDATTTSTPPSSGASTSPSYSLQLAPPGYTFAETEFLGLNARQVPARVDVSGTVSVSVLEGDGAIGQLERLPLAQGQTVPARLVKLDAYLKDVMYADPGIPGGLPPDQISMVWVGDTRVATTYFDWGAQGHYVWTDGDALYTYYTPDGPEVPDFLKAFLNGE